MEAVGESKIVKEGWLLKRGERRRDIVDLRAISVAYSPTSRSRMYEWRIGAGTSDIDADRKESRLLSDSMGFSCVYGSKRGRLVNRMGVSGDVIVT